MIQKSREFFTPLQIFQYHTLEVIRTENHFRKTMIDCVKDCLSESRLEEFRALEEDKKQWEILQEKIQNNRDLDLSGEIKQLQETVGGNRRQLYKSICYEGYKEDLKAIYQYFKKANELLDKVEPGSLVWQFPYQAIDTSLRQAWVELKKSNLERLSVETQMQNILIEWIRQCLNILPFWLPENSYVEFHQIKKMATTEQGLKEKIKHRKILSQKMLSFLKNMMEQLNENNRQFADSGLKLYQLLQTIQENLDNGRIKSCQLLAELKDQLNNFFEQIIRTKNKILEKVTLYDMKQDTFAAKYQLRPSDFCRAKYIQHRICASEKLLFQPDSILRSEDPGPASVVDWLDKKDYADLLFLLSILSPKYLEDCLQKKAILFQEIIENLQGQGKQFALFWGRQINTVTRSYRILGFYQRWQEALKKRLDKLGIIQEESREPKDNDWTTLFKLSRLFTYEKKNFFTEAFKKEDSIRLFSELNKLLEKTEDYKDPQKIINHIKEEKQAIKTKLEKQEAHIMSQYGFWEKMASFFGLAVTEQPTCKIGMMGFDIGLDSIDHIEGMQPEKTRAFYEKIDEWGNRLVPAWIQERLNPERDVKIIQSLTGVFCFIADQGVSSWMGYTYRSIAAINRVLFSQFDALVTIGAKAGLDEISLLEKEAVMNWFSGLGIHLILQNSNYRLPTFVSYTTATTFSFAASVLIDDLFKNEIEDKEWNPKAIAICKFALQAGIYSKIYSSSFKIAVEFSQSTEGMSTTQALKTMGFYSHPDKRDLKKRYYELALQNHHDKCINSCDDEKGVNTADCIESCEKKDLFMREVNQAYSHLKSLSS